MARGAKDWMPSTGAPEAESDVGRFASVTIGTTPTLVRPTNTSRQSLAVHNADANNEMRIGLDTTLTFANGMPLPERTYAVIVRWTGPVYAIANAAGLDLRYQEFDFP